VTGNDESALANTQVHYLSSGQVGDEFRIIVGGCEDAPAGVGVFVVLDAFFNYGTALETVRLLAMAEHVKPLLVVGVGYRPVTVADTTRLRGRDFSPVADPRGAEGNPAMSQGADRFAGFLEEELKPWILDRFDVARDDFGVFGFSLGGLFATHLMLTRPTAFQRYGIGSPSYWYGPKAIFATEESYANTHDDLPAKAYVSIGEYENPAGDDRHREQMTPEAREASLRAEAEFAMEDEVGYARDLVDRLRGRGYSSLDITFEVLQGEYHPTAPPRTISRAVRHLYDAPD
jgi:predicted alpha/beta superfamily hydrolase